MRISTKRFLEELSKNKRLHPDPEPKGWMTIEQLTEKTKLTPRKVRQALVAINKKNLLKRRKFVIETGVTGTIRLVDHFAVKGKSNIAVVVKKTKIIW